MIGQALRPARRDAGIEGLSLLQARANGTSLKSQSEPVPHE